MFDLNHPFFRPLWIRIAVTALCLGWAAFEFATGSPFWGMLFGGVGLACVHGFFLNFNPRDGAEKQRGGTRNG